MHDSQAPALRPPSVLRPVAHTFLRQALVVGISFGNVVLLARLLGPIGNGHFALAVLIPTLFSRLATFGIPAANVYFVSSGRVSLRGALAGAAKLWLGISVLASSVAAVMIEIWGETLFPGIALETLFLGLSALPFLLLESTLVSLLQARQDYDRYNHALLAGPALFLVLILVAVSGLNLRLTGAVAAFVIARIFSAMLAWLYVRRWRESETLAGDDNYIRSALSYGWRAHGSNVLAFVNYRADIFLVNAFLNPAAVGLYVVATQLAERIWIVPQSISAVLLPKFAAMTDERRRREILTVVARWAFVGTAVTAIAAALVAPAIVRFFFGEEFSQSATLVLWLIPGVVAWSLTNVYAADAAARGRPVVNLTVAAAAAIVNITCNVWWIPIWGTVGAALATTVSYGFSVPIMLLLHRRLSGMEVRDLWRWTLDDERLLAAIVPGGRTWRRHGRNL